MLGEDEIIYSNSLKFSTKTSFNDQLTVFIYVS